MRVAGVVEFGGPEVFQVVEVPDPVAGPGEVLIRNHAATVNPTDTYLRSGAYRRMLRDASPPHVPGMDAAGVVEALGEGVAEEGRLSVGQDVMAIVLPGPRGGAYAEKVVVPAASVVAAPAGTTHAEAATLPMNGLTARLALDLLQVPAGGTIAVTGAAGAFGGYVVQLAKVDGLRVIADASERDEELVRGLGADVVVRRGDDVAERILEHAPGGVDALADGSVQEALVVPAVRDGGGIAAVRQWSSPEPDRGVVVHPTWVSSYAQAWEKLDELRRLVEEGRLTLRLAETFPAEGAGAAHAKLEAGGTRGRLVVLF